MNRWLKFFYERCSPLVSSALAVGIILSGISINGTHFQLLPFILSFIGIIFVWALLCLIKDVKEFEKDKIAYPNRPLVQGIIKKQEALHLIEMMKMILFVYSLLLWVLFSSFAALGCFVILAYLWLVEKDFGMKLWLNRHPLFRSCCNQLIIFPIVFFAISAFHPVMIFYSSLWSFALMLFGGFFCCQICSELNPHAHPILGTAIHFYGFRKVFNVAVIALAVSAMGAVQLGMGYFLIPWEGIVLAGLSAVFFQPSLFAIPQFLASISLVMHVWAAIIYRI